MLRNVIAVVVGIAVAFATVMLIDKINHMVYPPPVGLDFTDPDAIRPYLATLPIGAFLFIFASSVVATFIGIMVACYIGTANSVLFAVIVGGIVLASEIANFIMIPHPLWLSVATVLGILAAALLAVRLAPPSGTALPELFDDDGNSG